MDFDAFRKQLEAQRKEQAIELRKTRDGLLKILRDLGVQSLTGEYSGYGDSGNVDDITYQPDCAIKDPLHEQLCDLIWSTAYNANPGFENNDGAEGTLLWDITTDSVTIEHGQHYTETAWNTTEGL